MTEITKLFMLLYCLIFVFILITLIHESAHVFALITKKIKVIAIYLGPLCIYNDIIWKVKIIKSLKNLFSGMTILQVPYLTDEKDWKKFKKNYLLSVLVGPAATGISIIAALLIYYLNYQFIKNIYALNLFILLFIVISGFILVGFFIKREDQLGDFYVYKTFRENDLLAQLNMYEYTLISKEYRTRNDSFLDNKLNLNSESFDFTNGYHINYIDNQLTLLLAKDKTAISDNVYNIIKFIHKNYKLLDLEFDRNVIFLCHLILFLVYIESRQSEGAEIYNVIRNRLNKNSKVMKYFKEQMEFCIGIKDNSQKLMDESFIYPFHDYERWSMFGSLSHYEKNITINCSSQGDFSYGK